MEQIMYKNDTMELSECMDKWEYNREYQCWCLEDILYTEKALVPKFQRMSIFVPEPYMKENGKICETGSCCGFTAKTAPVIFNNNSAGYMQMPHMWLGGPRCRGEEYLKHGFIYVTCGNRGHESKDSAGRFAGKAPANLVDLKTAIRFLRHNSSCLPGDMEKIISVGWSAGGAMSALLGVTGNSERYLDFLEENGAFMDERDDVFAAQIYCPIIDLEHADMAYEWMFGKDKENEASPAGPAGYMTEFQEALSLELQKEYIRYFNHLGLCHPKTGEPLILGEDGRSGSGYAYLMELLGQSAGKYLKRLEEGRLPVSYSIRDYLEGGYTYLDMAPPEPPVKGRVSESQLMQGHAGPDVSLEAAVFAEGQQEPPTLGDLLSRPPKGVDGLFPKPKMVEKEGKPKVEWLFWDGNSARIRDLDSYILNHRRRLKPCTAFDLLNVGSPENKVFGCQSQPQVHFVKEMPEILERIKGYFPGEYEKYAAGYQDIGKDSLLEKRVFLTNPLNFLQPEENSRKAEHFRIRVGASDADTSFSISMELAVRLMNLGYDTDYAFVWEMPHSEADYPEELCQWIREICK